MFPIPWIVVLAFLLIAPPNDILPSVPHAAAQEAVVASSSEEKQPMAKVKVKVTDESGKPIAGATAVVLIRNVTVHPIGQPCLTDSNGVVVITIPYSENYFLLKLSADGFATSNRNLQLTAGEEKEFDFKLSQPARGWIRITADGKPLSGAEFSFIEFMDVNQSKVYLTKDTSEQTGFTMELSDAEGRLYLPLLPKGATLKANVVHPNWKSVALESITVSSSELAVVNLEPGVQLSISLQGDDKSIRELEGKDAKIMLLFGGRPSSHPMSIKHSFAIRNGVVAFTAYPAEYQDLRFTLEDFLTSPVLANYPDSPNQDLDLSEKQPTNLKLYLHAKAKARGRVIDASGRGLKDAWVSGAIASKNQVPPSEEAESSSSQFYRLWVYAGGSQTDTNGFYELVLSPGKVRLEVNHEGYFSSPSCTQFEWSGKLEDSLPNITLLPVPKLKGNVVDKNGQPVIGSIVRLRHTGYGDPDAVGESSAGGSFELKLDRLPTKRVGDGLQTTVYALAFDPRTHRAGITEIDLTDPEATEKIRIELSEKDASWPLNVLKDKVMAPKLNEKPWQNLAERLQKDFSKGMPGNIPPAMTEGSWLNTDSRSLEDFRGKYVLLDFWFIGCGPCHSDLPSVRLAHKQFADLGFSVVSVHKDGQLPEDVQIFANANGMNFPIVVDDLKGTISKQYREYGVYGYPSYILLDPEGKIVWNDHVGDTGPSLRMFKLERIYQHLIARPAQIP